MQKKLPAGFNHLAKTNRIYLVQIINISWLFLLNNKKASIFSITWEKTEAFKSSRSYYTVFISSEAASG